MRPTLLLILVIFFCISTNSQNLIHSRRGSHFTAIYKLQKNEALEFIQNENPILKSSYFHTLVDYFHTDSVYREELPPGHYLYVKTIAGQLFGELESVNNLEMKILNNSRDLQLVFIDGKGKEVKSLKPMVDQKLIRFDNTLNVYRIPTTNKQGIVSVTHEGHENYFDIKRQYNNTFGARAHRRIFYTTPIRQITSPFRYIYRSAKSLIKWGRIDPPPIYYETRKLFEEKTFEGFMITNKPKYRPGDTVMLKAFITTRKGKPIKKEFDLYLGAWYGNSTRKTLGHLKPYRPGAYALEFVLSDSLKLNLDTQYHLTLGDKKDKHNYPYEGFWFEQYELKQNDFSIRSNENKLSKNKSKIIFLKGTDSNDMPLYDIDVSLVMTTKSVSEFYDPFLFVPDTLWTHNLKLDPLGETRVTIPDSIFLNAAFDVEVSALFRNAENEIQIKTLNLNYDSQLPEYQSKLSNDSIYFSSREPGESLSLSLFNANYDEQETRTVTLPYREKINPNVNYYELIKEKHTVETLELNTQSDSLEVMATRTKDSLIIDVQNPRKLFFRYQLFKSNRIIESGYSTTYSHRRSTSPNDRYYMAIQYIWGGSAEEKNYDLPFAKKPLIIDIDHPALVYPGQTAEFKINVHDPLGKPVKGADVTAMALSKKFKKTQNVDLRNYEKFKNRKAFNSFRPQKIDEVSIKQKLDYDFWKPRLGLDSISYYNFLYPKSGMFLFEHQSEDSITQVSPYIVKDGEVQTVHYIYFNSTLQYFNQVGNPEPYSFRTIDDTFHITLRLTDTLLTIKDVAVQKGKKLILSLDLKHLPSSAITIKREPRLSTEELNKIQPHFLWVQRNGDQWFAYFQEENNFRMLDFNNINQTSLVGPFFPGYIQYTSSDIHHTFDFRSARKYEFKKNLIDRDYMSWTNGSWLYPKEVIPSFYDQVLTKAQIEKQFKTYRSNKTFESPKSSDYFYYPPVSGNGNLTLKEKSKIQPIAKAIFFLNLNKPDEYFFYPGSKRSFQNLKADLYQVVVIYEDETYVRAKPILIQSYGKTFYDFAFDSTRQSDSFSKEVLDKISKWSTQSTYVEQNRNKEMQDMRERFYQEATTMVNFTGGHWVTGFVKDSQDIGIPGVNVIVKGTTTGTVTNEEGFYRIYMPYHGVLVFSFIGYSTQEVETGNRMDIDAKLVEDVQALQEVVVVGYSVQRKMDLMGSVSNVSSSFSGRVAGVQVNGRPVAADSLRIMVRGISSIDANSTPLYVVDGVIVNLADIDPDKITRMEILKSADAVAVYGARAASGVILISTKPGITRPDLLKTKLPEAIAIPEISVGAALRKNFRDYAFWKPKLLTDENGQVSFKATFPDDITAWNVNVIGLANKKRSGQRQSIVRSFKPLLAQLAMPHFLIEGDSASATGKITNYSPDSVTLTRTVSLGNIQLKKDEIRMLNSKIDSMAVIGMGDSLSMKYEILYKGYADGELRKIPVLKKGTMETKGLFIALTKDTAFNVSINPSKGKIKIHAEADVLDVLLDEIDQLRIYPYECNEQVASKLRALLAEKTIREYRKEKFAHDILIEKAIKKLITNQNKEGSWGWWENGNGSLWISRYVAGTLNWAKSKGYKVRYDETGLKNFVSAVELDGPVSEVLKSLIFISSLGEKVMGKSVIDSLAHNKKLNTKYDSLLAFRLLQLTKNDFDWKWIEKTRSETLRGNWYWGESRYTLWDNDVDNTLLVYQMMEHRNPNDPDLLKLRNYFIETRKQNWRNTYESARIIETLSQSLMHGEPYAGKPVLKLTGAINEEVTKFPYQKEIEGTANLAVSKSGSGPVYFTTYYKEWNPTPEKVEKDFIVKTNWSDPKKFLEAGKPVSLEITVQVVKDADYVMISVPIPAGCSYGSKLQSHKDAEVHREYDIHETRIYCEEMKKGTYHYTINLVPRYRGSYTLNPAKAEWMYFPTVFGRNGIGKTVIQ